MKLLTTLLALFAALSFNSIAYSAVNDQPIKNPISIQEVSNETEQSENDDDDCD